VWVNAQGFATWQILFSESPKQHESFVMFKGFFFTVFKIKLIKLITSTLGVS
jgi:hypothetical protein